VNSPVRWGIIGAGRFGRVHARALASVPGVKLVAISRRDPVKLAELAKELAVPRTYVAFQDLLADPEIEAVTICTHWLDHYDVALAALASGKHVLLEKPMAATSEQCQALLSAARSARGQFMVGHICRFDPRVTLAKQAFDDGRIGRVISMHAKRNLPIAPGHIRLDKISPLMGDGIHDADLMMWFMGRMPTRVYARNLRVENYKHPDMGWAMLEFGDEAIGVIETNWRLPANTPTQIDARIEVAGTAGQITIDCGHAGLSVLDEQGLKYPDTVYWPTQHGQLIGALVHELGYFAECIRANKHPTVVTPEEACQAVRVMEAAERSAASGQPVVIE
jgi:UDP-N-acetylglucosamine 3-dehydrogenase